MEPKLREGPFRYQTTPSVIAEFSRRNISIGSEGKEISNIDADDYCDYNTTNRGAVDTPFVRIARAAIILTM